MMTLVTNNNSPSQDHPQSDNQTNVHGQISIMIRSLKFYCRTGSASKQDGHMLLAQGNLLLLSLKKGY